MLRLVKSWMGEISANSSLSPSRRNQSNESRWTLIRFGMGATSGIRANECRAAPSARARETGLASASAIRLFHTSGVRGAPCAWHGVHFRDEKRAGRINQRHAAGKRGDGISAGNTENLKYRPGGTQQSTKH